MSKIPPLIAEETGTVDVLTAARVIGRARQSPCHEVAAKNRAGSSAAKQESVSNQQTSRSNNAPAQYRPCTGEQNPCTVKESGKSFGKNLS